MLFVYGVVYFSNISYSEQHEKFTTELFYQQAQQICLFFGNGSEKFPISQEISYLRFESWRTSLKKYHWIFLSFNWMNH